jgi:hypothetical protein
MPLAALAPPPSPSPLQHPNPTSHQSGALKTPHAWLDASGQWCPSKREISHESTNWLTCALAEFCPMRFTPTCWIQRCCRPCCGQLALLCFPTMLLLPHGLSPPRQSSFLFDSDAPKPSSPSYRPGSRMYISEPVLNGVSGRWRGFWTSLQIAIATSTCSMALWSW